MSDGARWEVRGMGGKESRVERTGGVARLGCFVVVIVID